jgi:hypothetical protein
MEISEVCKSSFDWMSSIAATGGAIIRHNQKNLGSLLIVTPILSICQATDNLLPTLEDAPTWRLSQSELLLRISDHIGGVYVAMEILVMRLSFDQEHTSPDELVEIGCELMRRLKVNGAQIPTSHTGCRLSENPAYSGTRVPQQRSA